jgi:aminopeptidase N
MADARLQEGFATYSEILFHEYLNGTTAYNKYITRISNANSGGVGIIGKRDVNANTFKNNDIYYKGAMVLHNLRQEVDDVNVFFQILRVFQMKFRNKTVDTNDFIETVNLVTQKDYRPFLMAELNR